MTCVVRGFVQSGSTREANRENHEDTEQQRAHRTGYLASRIRYRLTGPDRSHVHRQSPLGCRQDG